MCESCECKPVARSRVYEFVSVGFCYPNAGTVRFLQDQLADVESCLTLLDAGPSLEALRDLVSVITPCSPAEIETEYIQCFGHTVSKEHPPYEAEYGQAHVFQQTHTLADIAGFYKAFGLQPAPDFHDRLDHLSVELEFLHFLCAKEAYALAKGHPQEQLAVCREAQAKFLAEHLGQWALGFAQKLQEKDGGTLYGLLGRLLQAFLTFEMRHLRLKPGRMDVALPREPASEEMEACETCSVLAPLIEPITIVPRA